MANKKALLLQESSEIFQIVHCGGVVLLVIFS